MSYSLRYKVSTLLTLGVAALVLVPLLTVVFAITLLAAIPSRVGRRAPVEDWIFKTLTTVLDVELMIQFRDDIYRILFILFVGE
jgi:hypothetical protein